MAEREDKKRGRYFLIKWVGYEKPSWEPAKHIISKKALGNWEAWKAAHPGSRRREVFLEFFTDQFDQKMCVRLCLLLLVVTE
jgi:hypothetical protein